MTEERNGRSKFWLGAVLGVCSTLLIQAGLDRLRVETRIAQLENDRTDIKLQLGTITTKLDYLYNAQLRYEGESKGRDKAKESFDGKSTR